jgi:hypothetical protein
MAPSGRSTDRVARSVPAEKRTRLMSALSLGPSRKFLCPLMAISRHRDVPLGRQQLTDCVDKRFFESGFSATMEIDFRSSKSVESLFRDVASGEKRFSRASLIRGAGD